MTSQVLKAFHACVSEKLSKASSSCPALNSLCEQVLSSMNSLLSPKNHELLSDSLPARDLAFSLGRIYIGMLSYYPSLLLLLLFLHHLWDQSVYTTVNRANYDSPFSRVSIFTRTLFPECILRNNFTESFTISYLHSMRVFVHNPQFFPVKIDYRGGQSLYSRGHCRRWNSYQNQPNIRRTVFVK